LVLVVLEVQVDQALALMDQMELTAYFLQFLQHGVVQVLYKVQLDAEADLVVVDQEADLLSQLQVV
jgi:hypothetical protein